jgi:glycosyltransferase involved in cell wall biosynthesis
LKFSIIIAVYNRPEELDELLHSIRKQNPGNEIEVVVVDDGSDNRSNLVVEKHVDAVDIKYCFKKNTGPGDSRNFGMERASGDYFIILDSDCILPDHYLKHVSRALQENYTDAYGGPDTAHPSFSAKQKAINYSMTSFLSTGGLRGSEGADQKFQLRSFNMGLSKKAFLLTGGFAKQRIGEDIDLNFRLKKHRCSARYMLEAFVYHKRRSSWREFFHQTRNFGAARPLLSKMHPGTGKLSYWLPSLFVTGLFIAAVLYYFDFYLPLLIYGLYFIAVGLDSTVKNKSLLVGFLSVLAVLVQFLGYGSGFLRSIYRLYLLRKTVTQTFPGMFT